MTVFQDLTPYTYWPDQHPGAVVLNVGWLDEGVEFPQREPAPEFVQALRELAVHESVCRTRGYHRCGLCPVGRDERDPLSLGSAEVHVTGADGTVYAAPNLFHHYVAEHHYAPPAEFVAAVLAARADGAAEWARVKARLPVGAVVRGSSGGYHFHRGLEIELDGFPQVTGRAAFQEFGADSAAELDHEFGATLEFVVRGYDEDEREVLLGLP